MSEPMRSSKFQAPSTREAPNTKVQIAERRACEGGFENRKYCRRRRKEAHFFEKHQVRVSLRRLLQFLEFALGGCLRKGGYL